ncbi:MAG TPA: RsmD family RNA methyltransferase [Bacteroidales bacterium]|nr:RsmD family RNA methyltransferase [Bacteroidales bacterium]
MRIISGSHKGRVFRPGKNLPVRPTTDYAKESLFNILNNKIDFEELSVLDLFAGTGSISFEFASRGAKDVTSVDLSFHCVDFIHKTAESFQFSNIRTVKANCLSFIGYCKVQYDLIFADPPYDLKDIQTIPHLIFNKGLLKENGLFIIEHPQECDFSTFPFFSEHRNYGKVNFSFFMNKTKE